MLTGDGADYRAAEEGRRGHTPAPAQGAGRHQGQSLRRAGQNASSSSSATPSSRRSASRRRRSSIQLAKQNAVVPAGIGRDLVATHPAARHRRARRRRRPSRRRRSKANGRVFRLGDIATVTRGYEDPPTFIVRQRGKPALGIGVVDGQGRQHSRRSARTLPAPPREFIDGGAARHRDRADRRPAARSSSTPSASSCSSFVEALAIVLVVSFLVARLAHRHRGGALGAAGARDRLHRHVRDVGMDLHRITLGALIIALGLLVDDAIIAVEMMVVKMEQGWDRVRAARPSPGPRPPSRC